jgi:hypothetical protein
MGKTCVLPMIALGANCGNTSGEAWRIPVSGDLEFNKLTLSCVFAKASLGA